VAAACTHLAAHHDHAAHLWYDHRLGIRKAAEALKQRRWIACRGGFFLPVRVLSALFRGKFLALLEESFRAGQLGFFGRLEALNEVAAFARRLAEARRQKWVVYARAPFQGTEAVLKYLARYTHRIAISNARLRSIEEAAVGFTYQDYRRQSQEETLWLPGTEFVRRFLLHALPKGFVRIRRYGLLANAQRERELARCRARLEAVPPPAAEEVTPRDEGSGESGGRREEPAPKRCPACGEGRLQWVAELAPLWRRWRTWRQRSRAPPMVPKASTAA
jgi:hypothetical protein